MRVVAILIIKNNKMDTMSMAMMEASLPPPPMSVELMEHWEQLKALKKVWNEYYQSVLNKNFRGAKQALEDLFTLLSGCKREDSPLIEFVHANNVIGIVTSSGLADDPLGLLAVTARFLALLAGHLPPMLFVPETFRGPMLQLLREIDIGREGDERTRDSVIRMAAGLALLIASAPLGDLFLTNGECPVVETLWKVLQLNERMPEGLYRISLQSLSSLFNSEDSSSALVNSACDVVKAHFLVGQPLVWEELLMTKPDGPLVVAFVEAFKNTLTYELALGALREATRQDFLIPAVSRLITTNWQTLDLQILRMCFEKAPQYFFSNELEGCTSYSLKEWKQIVDPLSAQIRENLVFTKLCFQMTCAPVHLRNETCQSAFFRYISLLPLEEAIDVLCRHPLTPQDLFSNSSQCMDPILRLYSWQRLALNKYVSVKP